MAPLDCPSTPCGDESDPPSDRPSTPRGAAHSLMSDTVHDQSGQIDDLLSEKRVLEDRLDLYQQQEYYADAKIDKLTKELAALHDHTRVEQKVHKDLVRFVIGKTEDKIKEVKEDCKESQIFKNLVTLHTLS